MKEINVLRLKKRNGLKQKKKQISIKYWSKDPQSMQHIMFVEFSLKRRNERENLST